MGNSQKISVDFNRFSLGSDRLVMANKINVQDKKELSDQTAISFSLLGKHWAKIWAK